MTETPTCASTSDQIRSGYTAVNELMNLLLFSGSSEREREREGGDREGRGGVRVKRKRYLR